MRTLFARQAIYDINGNICAYELLYRNVDERNGVSVEPVGDIATSFVITQLFVSMDIDRIIGTKKAFINFTYNHLLQEVPSLLPKEKIIIEVLETVVPDERVINALKKLRDLGYQIALDDFIFKKELIPFVKLAHFIKIDVLNCDEKQIKERIRPLKKLFKGKLIAEKIENEQQYEWCKALGFDYYQGFLFNIPELMKGKVVIENKVKLLKLLSILNDEALSSERAEELIFQIPQLGERLVSLINNLSCYTDKPITSLSEGIKELGPLRIRDWLIILLVASLEDVSLELLERTLIRAKMCESLAVSINLVPARDAYTLGMLSTVDVLLNDSMEQVLTTINLNSDLKEALLYHKGPLGMILKFTLDYEKANFNSLEQTTIDQKALTHSYLQGIDYANRILDILEK